MRLDHKDRTAIQWYVDRVMLEEGKTPNKTSPYGYGTLRDVARTFIEWGEKYGHTYWSTTKGITTNAMSQRVKDWCNNASINSFNKADAEWVAKTIRMKYDDAGSTHTVEQEQEDAAVLEELQAAPVVPDNKVDTTLDGIRAMAQSMRQFVDDVDDPELTTIMANTELKLLRLLADRL